VVEEAEVGKLGLQGPNSATVSPANAPPGPAADAALPPVEVPPGVEVPDTEATHIANALISLVVRELLNEGMIAPPSVIWSAMRVAGGRTTSRFGPTWPLAPAAASVWQPPQPA
jgi:hypothetical protein